MVFSFGCPLLTKQKFLTPLPPSACLDREMVAWKYTIYESCHFRQLTNKFNCSIRNSNWRPSTWPEVKNIETGTKSTGSWWLTVLRFLCNNQTVTIWETLSNIYLVHHRTQPNLNLPPIYLFYVPI